jgi:hypothetical protein
LRAFSKSTVLRIVVQIKQANPAISKPKSGRQLPQSLQRRKQQFLDNIATSVVRQVAQKPDY